MKLDDHENLIEEVVRRVLAVLDARAEELERQKYPCRPSVSDSPSGLSVTSKSTTNRSDSGITEHPDVRQASRSYKTVCKVCKIARVHYSDKNRVCPDCRADIRQGLRKEINDKS